MIKTVEDIIQEIQNAPNASEALKIIYENFHTLQSSYVATDLVDAAVDEIYNSIMYNKYYSFREKAFSTYFPLFLLYSLRPNDKMFDLKIFERILFETD